MAHIGIFNASYPLFIIYWFDICDSREEVFLLKLTFLSCWVNNEVHVAIVEVDFAFLLGYKEVQIAKRTDRFVFI
jgi:hypothetical protein